ncbi:MAG: potassium transporter KtrB [Clostridia bacterium]|nr:potassium transporter KtrB [Clostridia bacterium]
MRKKSLSPIQIIMGAFLLVILAGSLLLSLPVSSASGKAVGYIDALFTATTSTCVTGLVTLPTVTTWSFFGQLVILILIQIGGLGVITVLTGLMLLMKRKLGIGDRILIGESFNLNSLDGMVRLVKKVITITLIIEGVGALLYMSVFVPEFGLRGIWISIFTSVSAFCNAGIDIIAENSLCSYALNPVINITTMLLIIFGGIGFIVLLDIGKMLKNKKRRHFKFLSLHSKIVLSVTSFLIIAGATLFFIFEYNNPLSIKEFSVPEKIMVSLFQSVTTRTAGFATIAQENLTNASAFWTMLLMFVGGSPAGTAGGIKTVTLFVLFANARAVVRNKRTVDAFDRQLSVDAIKRAEAVFVTSLFIVIASTLFLSAFSDRGFLDIIYETVSATATVGLSRNFTGTLNAVGKIIIIMTMYLGRVGPISLAFAFAANKKSENVIINPVEEISIG